MPLRLPYNIPLPLSKGHSYNLTPYPFPFFYKKASY
jgi:hypothetical protein